MRAERAHTCTLCTGAAACGEQRYCSSALFWGLNPPENALPPIARVSGRVCCKRPGINCVPSLELLEPSASNTQPERLTGLSQANQGQNTAGYNDYEFLRYSTRIKLAGSRLNPYGKSRIVENFTVTDSSSWVRQRLDTVLVQLRDDQPERSVYNLL